MDHAAAVAALEKELDFFSKKKLAPEDFFQAIAFVHSAIGLEEQCRCSGHSPELFIVSPKDRIIVKAGVISQTVVDPLGRLEQRVAQAGELASMFDVELCPLTERTMEQFYRAARAYDAGVVSVLAPVGPVSKYRVHINGEPADFDPVEVVREAVRSDQQ